MKTRFPEYGTDLSTLGEAGGDESSTEDTDERDKHDGDSGLSD